MEGQWQSSQVAVKEILSRYEDKNVHSETNPTVEEISQGSWGVSILADIQSSSSHGPEKLALLDNSLRKKLDWMTPRSLF